MREHRNDTGKKTMDLLFAVSWLRNGSSHGLIIIIIIACCWFNIEMYFDSVLVTATISIGRQCWIYL